MTVPVLRSVGNGNLHPVGQMTKSNYFVNPGFRLNASGTITYWSTVNCAFTTDLLTPAIPATVTGKIVTSSIGIQTLIYQAFLIDGGTDYTISSYLNIPVARSVPVGFYAYMTDINGIPVYSAGAAALASGLPTAGWVRASQVFTAPGNAAVLYAYLIDYGYPTAIDTLYCNGLQFEKSSTASPYNDGSMSGYLWSGAPDTSQTLKTEYADAFAAFGTYPLQGGMGAGASMYVPQFAKLVD